MAIAQRLSRYASFAHLLTKYGSSLTASDSVDGRDIQTEHAEAFARDLEALGPAFVKLGQLLSSRTDLIGPAYAAALSRLQDNVERFPFEQVVETIEQELQVKASKVFSTLSQAPLAAASLGQVHHATLRDGRDVAVKVQRPAVRARILEDLDALDEAGPFIARVNDATRRLDVPALLGEFRRTLLAELDYRLEAKNMVAIAHQLRNFGRILVPLPIEDLTSAHVLTMDYIEGKKITGVHPVEWTEIDRRALASDLFRAYMQQVLVDGLFHADPHPGNVLLTPDHRLALVDLGMVGSVSPELQERLLRLVLAVGAGRGDEAAESVIALGDKQIHFDEAQLRRTTTGIVLRYQHGTTRDVPIGRTMLDLARCGREHGLVIQPEFAMLGKTLLQLDEIGRVLDLDFDVSGAIRRYGRTVMRQRLTRAPTLSRALASVLEGRELAEKLPVRLNRILDSLAGNDLRIKVEVIDQGAILEGLQTVANRIAVGLVLAALIVGAAMLSRVPTTFTLFGYPGVAMLLFLGAATGGVWMTWTVASADRRRRLP